MAVRVLIDARKIGDGGIGVYIENLVDGLLALKDAKVIDFSLSLLLPEVFFESGSALSTHYKTNGIGSIFHCARIRWGDKVRYICEPAPKYSVREHVWLPIRQRKVLAEHDIFHSPHFTLPYGLGIPSVVTIHDVIHLSHPEKFYHRPLGRWMIRSALRRADHVVTVSDYSARHLQTVARGIGTPVSVVPNAFRPSLTRRSPAEVRQFLEKEFITREYCLYVGSERPHKGFGELLDAWGRMAKECPLERCPDLIVVGKKFSSARDRAHEMNLDGNVRFFGEINLERLTLLYSGATAVMVPSRAEGFGLPALEAMGLGVPVVCASIPSLREVCADAAFYAERNNGECFADAVCQVFSNPSRAQDKARIGLERAQLYTAEACALKTWKVYEQVLGIPRSEPGAEGGVIRKHAQRAV